MRCVGTVVRGIRTPVIKDDTNLVDVVIDSLMRAKESEGFTFRDRDIVAITEAVVGISEGNYATTSQIAMDVRNKFNNEDHIGIVFPTPMSRNRFSLLLKGFAKGCKKITMLLNFPSDEVGNQLFTLEDMDKYNLSMDLLISEEKYMELFGNTVHQFTGVNYVNYFRELVNNEGCEIEFVLSNRASTILEYTKNIIVANIHGRERVKKELKSKGANIVIGTDEILRESVDGSGYNSKYGLLGSNKATEDKVKLFPEHGQKLVEEIQKRLFELTGKKIEVMVYGDGAFKDPVGGIWELADPVVSPFYTSGLEGTPNEIKLKYVSDNKYADLRGEELNNAIKEEIREKGKNLTGSMISQGTTPRRLTDLIGSLCDLTSGSGDKGTPVVFIQGYFDNYGDE
ncbi:MAG: coenzyme F420-0:L-glutamate ligase [Bacilli bacterium]|nr:coenzyme F420-0:L-glutamate ligase [Bacilli bacterium]